MTRNDRRLAAELSDSYPDDLVSMLLLLIVTTFIPMLR